MKRIGLTTLAILFMASHGFSQIIHVPADQLTIQNAIDASSVGDTVLVHPGIYKENINLMGKNIVVGSKMLTTGDTAYIRQTVIDGNQNGSVVIFNQKENESAELNGFTITNGSGSGYEVWGMKKASSDQTHGGGILMANGASPVLRNLLIIGNVASSCNGAGIWCGFNTHPFIENVIVTGNDGTGSALTNDGSGGIYMSESSPTLKNVQITNNKGVISGGLCIWGNCNPVMMNLTIANNQAYGNEWTDQIAEVIIDLSNPVFINTIIWNQSLKSIVERGYSEESSITITHSDIYGGNGGIIYYSPIEWLEGNIDEDPMFENAESNNYELQAESPCIDGGIQDTILLINNGADTIFIPSMSYSGFARDIGAYEFGPLVSIGENENKEDIITAVQLYPNPTDDVLFIDVKDNFTFRYEVRIMDLKGGVIFSQFGNIKQIDLSSFQKGVYFITIRSKDFVTVRKIIKL